MSDDELHWWRMRPTRIDNLIAGVFSGLVAAAVLGTTVGGVTPPTVGYIVGGLNAAASLLNLFIYVRLSLRYRPKSPEEPRRPRPTGRTC